MWLLLVALAAVVPGGGPEKEIENAGEIAHRVSFALVAPDVAVLTVTRTFAPRSMEEGMRLDGELGLPSGSVVTSFAFRSGGRWRKGRLRPSEPIDEPTKRRQPVGARSEPWASLEGTNFGAVHLLTPSLPMVREAQIRYTLWAQAEPMRGGRRWLYCDDLFNSNEGEGLLPEISLPSGHPELRVRPESKTCVAIEKTEPDARAPAARFGVYQLGAKAWWWWLELAVPERIAAAPALPVSAPIVFVLDASRSQGRLGGLPTQLAIVRAALANMSDADVELVLTSRTAQRVFGRFVPAAKLSELLPADLAGRPLGNGSFLDRGAARAAEALAETAKPGRIVLMTDGQLRSRFSQSATIASLRRAPAGTVVHLVYPESSGSPEELRHHRPEGLSEMSAVFGGAAYSVNVEKKAGSLVPPSPQLLRDLIRPGALESIDVSDASRADRPDWPEWLETHRVEAGGSQTWKGLSQTRPPARLTLTGWLWGKKLELSIRPARAFERRLARLANSDETLMGCESTTRSEKDALRQGFLTQGLTFWVPGTGEAESYGSGSSPYSCSEGSGGGGTSAPPSKPQDLLPHVGKALEPCGLVSDPAGRIQAKVETNGDEILDVVIEGAKEQDGRCMEEVLWGLSLPADFNGQTFWSRADYTLTFSARETRP
jgi:hypothetical protein